MHKVENQPFSTIQGLPLIHHLFPFVIAHGVLDQETIAL